MSKQEEFQGMPTDPLLKTPIGQAAKRFAEAKELIARTKLEMEEHRKTIIVTMKQEHMTVFRISVDGENFRFEFIPGKDDIRCAKITKQPRAKEPKNDVFDVQEGKVFDNSNELVPTGTASKPPRAKKPQIGHKPQ